MKGLVNRIRQIRALGRQRPDHLFYQLARLVLLPLRQNDGVAYLQAMLIGLSGKLRAPVKRGDIGGVQRRRHFGGIDAACLFDGVLKNNPEA